VENHVTPDTPSAQEAQRLIAAGPSGWRLRRLGRPGTAVGRVLGMVLRGRMPHQQMVNRRLLESVGHVNLRVDTLVERLDAADRAQSAIANRLTSNEELADDLILAGEAGRAATASVAARIGDPEELPRIEDVLAASRARPYVSEPFPMWDEPGAGTVMGFVRAGDGEEAAEERYKLFEDRFRGPEARVTDLQRPYLKLLDGRGTVLDVGCGRGEMLDLLRERGIAAHGIDIDVAMIARCVEKGHVDAEVADVNAHLESVPDGTYGAIFCAQVVEHLPYGELVEMLGLAARKLRPDGIFVAETVNPHAPHALRAFWTDLTHQHPIFPEVALALCELAGFRSAYVFHPTGTGSIAVDSWAESAYAVVARLSQPQVR